MNSDALAARQNADGGWPYVRGVSWTEPSVYAILALLAAGDSERAGRGMRWLRGMQRHDGGFPPQAGIEDSCWATALVALLPAEVLGAESHSRAIHWLLGATGRESTRSYRLREWLLGNARPADQEFSGWPWIPGAAAWVGPTSIAVLALDKENRKRPSRDLQRRIYEGRHFLLTRTCDGGGWNHGGVHALGYESRAYPETTGMALAALRGLNTAPVIQSVEKAKMFLADSRSADALNWLHLGLMAHGSVPNGYCRPTGVECRTLPETSLRVLVTEAEKGRNVLWG